MRLLLYLNQNAQPTFPRAHQMCMRCHLKIRLEILIDNKKRRISATDKETDEPYDIYNMKSQLQMFGHADY